MFNKYTKIAIIAILAAMLLVAVVVLYMQSRNPYGDSAEITNFNEYTSVNSDNRNVINAIKYNLLKTINLNLKEKLSGDEVNDIIIRKDSFKESYDEKNDIHSVVFIVDIESLKQSYGVSYQWVGDKGDFNTLDQYGSIISCLALDQLKYGNFNCIDDRIKEKGALNYDPVEKILPYTVQYQYTIKSYLVTLDKTVLNIDAFIPSWENKNTKLDEYTAEINKWLSSKKLDPKNYELNFTY